MYESCKACGKLIAANSLVCSECGVSKPFSANAQFSNDSAKALGMLFDSAQGSPGKRLDYTNPSGFRILLILTSIIFGVSGLFFGFFFESPLRGFLMGIFAAITLSYLERFRVTRSRKR